MNSLSFCFSPLIAWIIGMHNDAQLVVNVNYQWLVLERTWLPIGWFSNIWMGRRRPRWAQDAPGTAVSLGCTGHRGELRMHRAPQWAQDAPGTAVSLGHIRHHRRFNYWDPAGGGADGELFRVLRLTLSSSEKNRKDTQLKAKVGVVPGLLLWERFLPWMVQVVVGTKQSVRLFPGSQGTRESYFSQLQVL